MLMTLKQDVALATVVDVAAPTFDVEKGTYSVDQVVHLACTTARATLRYTVSTDGTEPADPTLDSTLYTEGILIGGNQTVGTVKAVAFLTDTRASAVSRVQVTINYLAVSQPAAAFYGGGSVTSTILATPLTADAKILLSTASVGIPIRYTLTAGATGVAPVASSTLYQDTSPISIVGDTTTASTVWTLQAQAMTPGGGASSVLVLTFTVQYPQVAVPTITVGTAYPADATQIQKKDVTITGAALGASQGALLRYTTDGTAPTETTGTLIASGGQFTLTESATVNVIAYKAAMYDSTATQAVSVAVAVPTGVVDSSPDPSSSFYFGTRKLTLACATPGVEIWYTTDGTTTPTASSPHYNASFNLADTATVRMVAHRSGNADSAMGSVAVPITHWKPTGNMPVVTQTSSEPVSYALGGSSLYVASLCQLVRLDLGGTAASEITPAPLARGASPYITTAGDLAWNAVSSRLYFAYTDLATNLLGVQKYDATAGSWTNLSSRTSLPAVNAIQIGVAFNAAGVPYVAYVPFGGVSLSVISWDSGTSSWVSVATLAAQATGTISCLSFTIGTDGYPWVAFADTEAGVPSVVVEKFVPGTGWTANLLTSSISALPLGNDTYGNVWCTDLAADPHGDVVFGYGAKLAATSSRAELRFVRFDTDNSYSRTLYGLSGGGENLAYGLSSGISFASVSVGISPLISGVSYLGWVAFTDSNGKLIVEKSTLYTDVPAHQQDPFAQVASTVSSMGGPGTSIGLLLRADGNPLVASPSSFDGHAFYFDYTP